MQSHASRHVVSEHLKDRFPLADGGAFQQGVIPLEIARSYGRRGIPKLVDVLKYFLDPNAPAKPDVALALRVLRDELSNQEKKGQAITYGSCPVLTALLKNEDKEIRKLACEVLASLATFFMGRLSMIQCGTIESLVPAVANTTEEAANTAPKLAKRSPSGPQNGCREPRDDDSPARSGGVIRGPGGSSAQPGGVSSAPESR